MAALPERLLDVEQISDALVPSYLAERDQPWLRELLDECEALAGLPLAVVRRQLMNRREDPRARRRRAIAVHLVLQELGEPPATAVAPAAARSALFCARARESSRDDALRQAAHRLGVSSSELESALFADLSGERRLRLPEPPLDPTRLALQCNLSIAQALLRRADRAILRFRGRARTVVQTARIRGLLFEVREVGVGGAVGGAVELCADAGSADPGLRRRQGQALASLLPLLPWCHRFRLRARCRLRAAQGWFTVASGDPILPAPEPLDCHSAVELRLARELRRQAGEWELLREPVPLRAGEHLWFPDFGLVHRDDEERRCLVEVVGYWTEDYLRRKRAVLSGLGDARCLLCVDATVGSARELLGDAVDVLWYRRWVPVDEVLARVAAM